MENQLWRPLMGISRKKKKNTNNYLCPNMTKAQKASLTKSICSAIRFSTPGLRERERIAPDKQGTSWPASMHNPHVRLQSLGAVLPFLAQTAVILAWFRATTDLAPSTIIESSCAAKHVHYLTSTDRQH